MLSIFRTHKKTITGVIMIGLAVILMVAWGIDARGSYRRAGTVKEAVRIGKQEISEREYYREVEEMTDQLRLQLQGNFDRFRSMINIEQITLDRLIDRTLITSYVATLGLTASIEQIQRHLAQDPFFFSTGLTQEAYHRYLSKHGFTDEMAEERARVELASEQLSSLFADLSMPSAPELRSLFMRQNTKYEFSYIPVAASAFESKVDRSDSALNKYFSDHSESYKKPRSIRYRFVRFDPAEFAGQVALNEDEIQERYEQRQSQYFEPKQIKLSQIVFKKGDKPSQLEQMVAPKAEDPDQKAAKQQQAKQVVERLRAGENFAALAKEVSEDDATKAKGGEVGWLKVADIEKNLRGVADQLAAGKFSDVLETPDSFVVIFAGEIQERRQKELAEVREQIVRDMQNEQAPDYARVAAEEFAGKLQDAPEKGLDVFATEQKRSAVDSERRLIATEDPAGVPPGLTKQLISLPKGERTVKHAGNSEFVVEVTETKDSYIPELHEVKDAVMKDFVAAESDRLAKEAATAALAETRAHATDAAAFDGAAKKLAVDVKSTPSVTPKTPGTDELLTAPDAATTLFTLTEQAPLAPAVLGSQGTYFLARLKTRTTPDEKAFDTQELDLVRSERTAVGNRSSEFMMKTLRGAADIWINPEVLDAAAKGAKNLG